MIWSFQNDSPIYAQLIQGMTLRIVSGAYGAGEKLPSVRDLSAEAGVNPNTMQRALTELERLGLMFSQRTAGRFVTEDITMIENAKKGLADTHVRSFLAAMTALGYQVPDIIALLNEREFEKEEGICPQS